MIHWKTLLAAFAIAAVTAFALSYVTDTLTNLAGWGEIRPLRHAVSLGGAVFVTSLFLFRRHRKTGAL